MVSIQNFVCLLSVILGLHCEFTFSTGKLFWYKVHYNVHVRTHTKEHSHYCSKCSYSSITKSSLKRHQIQKHSGLQLSCSSAGCKYTTPDKYKLQAHLRMHQYQVSDLKHRSKANSFFNGYLFLTVSLCLQGKSVTCSICQNSYPEHRLKYHLKTSHPGKAQHTPSNTISLFILHSGHYLFQCCLITVHYFSSMCLCFVYFWIDALPAQAKSVMVKRAEKCSYCDSYFLKNSSDYQRHIWAHQGVIFLNIYLTPTHMLGFRADAPCFETSVV